MENFTLEVRVRICPAALLDHSRLAILPSLLVTSRVLFSSEALQLFFLRLLPMCYSPGTEILNVLGFWSQALKDELECVILNAEVFENFFDPLSDEVIARFGLTWQAAFESVTTFSIFRITPQFLLSRHTLLIPQRSPAVSSFGVPLGSSFLAFSSLL